MTNRREALKVGAAGLATSMLGGYTRGAADEKTYRVGLIGCGWYGKSDLFRLIQVAPVEVVSLCDPDAKQLAHAAEMTASRQKSGKTPRTYRDYRDMLKEKDLDIVLVGTPDHWHALPMIAAVESGADVYVQKPISHDVLEGEAMVAAARKHGKVVQVGTQRKSTPHLIEAKKRIVEAGLLGKVGRVELCCYYHMRANGDPEVTTPPDYFDYNLWSGPAPLRPFDGMPHVRWWRTFMEYGSGITGDMCVHMLDTVRWMLGLGWPKKISSTGGILVQKTGKSNITDTQEAVFEYPEFDVIWSHRTWGTPPDPDYPWALFIYGEKGTLKASTMRYDFIPQGKGEKIHGDCVFEREKYPEDVTEPEIELNAAPATRLHMRNFLDNVVSRGKPVADIEEGHISTASCLLANIAMKLGRPVVYDPSKRLVVGDDEATRLLRGPYRAPWVHPAEGLG
ncbi:Gfo/Idh/MocA family protein [Paludisphaera rhizosphaerae]|uniref:Gfo/Idh/MocA family protein n=1 Tax=Paludisphaera rhizosphaerae TaxID=2711216 RepID=UPI0013EB6575|nr:Gfo/Idh/MocA family oxidoreductase [Paludisphaera rhizosphaerae]